MPILISPMGWGWDKDDLLFLSGFQLLEKVFHLRVTFLIKENAIDKQFPFGHQLAAVKPAQVLVAGIRQIGSSLPGNTLQRVAGGNFDGDSIHFTETV